MIANVLRSEIEARVPALAGKVYPVDVVLNQVQPPACVYVCVSKTAFRSLSGKLHHYSEKITLDFLTATVDDCAALYDAVEAVLYTLPRTHGILRLSCISAEPDTRILPESLIRKNMTVEIDWKE